jgi:hypothetical protein
VFLCCSASRIRYGEGVAGLSSVFVIDECRLNLAEDLADDIGDNPEPDGAEGILNLSLGMVIDLKLLESLPLLSFILIGQNEEDGAEADHSPIDNKFS